MTVPPEVSAFVDSAFASFDDAFREDGTEQFLDFAGRTVLARFASPPLRDRLLGAFSHLAASPAPPDLTICCWADSDTHAQLPPPPWKPYDFVGLSWIRGHITGPLPATFDRDGRLFQLYDVATKRCVFHVGDSATLPQWHDRSPFRDLIRHWADNEKLAVLHGSAVGLGEAAVVLAGVSGSGKSTTAAACVAAGFEFLGDDACLVDVDTGTACSLYRYAKVEPDALGFLGGIDSLHAWGSVDVDEEGAYVVAPTQTCRRKRLRAVLLIGVGTRSEAVLTEPLDPSDALAELIETVREENHGLNPAVHATLSHLVQEIPVLRLTLGADLPSAIATIGGLLR